MLGVDDQDKADDNAHGTPKKIDKTIPYRDMGFTISGAGSLDEAVRKCLGDVVYYFTIWSGHSVQMGTEKRDWQEMEEILSYFGG